MRPVTLAVVLWEGRFLMDLAHLVTLALNGDEQAKSVLLDRAARLVYARIFRRIGATSAAEDVAQDTLVALLTGLPRLRNSPLLPATAHPATRAGQSRPVKAPYAPCGQSGDDR